MNSIDINEANPFPSSAHMSTMRRYAPHLHAQVARLIGESHWLVERLPQVLLFTYGCGTVLVFIVTQVVENEKLLHPEANDTQSTPVRIAPHF